MIELSPALAVFVGVPLVFIAAVLLTEATAKMIP